MKKIMILGAGTYQVPLIKVAKEMGLYTIVVSVAGNYPGFGYADKIYYEDTTNAEKIIEIAKEEQIDGIVTAGTDVAVITIGRVCDELGLCGLSGKAAQIASDKMLMKTVYEKDGVRTARFRKVALEYENVMKAVRELTFPLIFKAVDTSGSRGIVRVNKEEEIIEAIEVVKRATKREYFIVEEFLIGEEFGAQAYVLNHEIQFILPHGDYVFVGDTGVPIGHFAPYLLSEEAQEDTKIQLTKAISAMGLNNCAINADFILVGDKCYVLEIGGRSGATCLAELTSIYYNFNYYKKIIEASLGNDVDFSSEYSVPNASKLLMSEKDGRIKEMINKNTECEDIYEIQFDYNVGDCVRKFKVGPDRIGHVITKGDTLQEAVELLDKTLSKITINVE